MCVSCDARAICHTNARYDIFAVFCVGIGPMPLYAFAVCTLLYAIVHKFGNRLYPSLRASNRNISLNRSPAKALIAGGTLNLNAR